MEEVIPKKGTVVYYTNGIPCGFKPNPDKGDSWVLLPGDVGIVTGTKTRREGSYAWKEAKVRWTKSNTETCASPRDIAPVSPWSSTTGTFPVGSKVFFGGRDEKKNFMPYLSYKTPNPQNPLLFDYVEVHPGSKGKVIKLTHTEVCGFSFDTVYIKWENGTVSAHNTNAMLGIKPA